MFSARDGGAARWNKFGSAGLLFGISKSPIQVLVRRTWGKHTMIEGVILFIE